MFDTEFEDTELFYKWDKAINRGNPNDFVALVTASSMTPVSGTGKSTLLTVLAQEWDQSPDGYTADRKATLDVGELAYQRVPELESLSAVVGDEMQGAPGTVGFDRRRGMKQEVVDGISSILANRDKQFTVLLGAQHIGMLDIRLLGVVDAWLMIKYEPDHHKGPLLTHHDIRMDDYNLRDPKIRTPALEDLTWPVVPHDDPDYETLERMKQEAKSKRSDGEGDEFDPLGERNQRIKQLYESGVKQTKIAEGFDMDQSQISRIVNS